MTVQQDALPKKTSLNTPLMTILNLNWEVVFYVAIFVIALITRFYDLGARVMSHDESLHTVYSWNLYAGKGYQHDPLMHGPFLFHINALMYFLFGDNDFTARISTALLGTILVILPYWFRPWLGRLGALAASVMILISPGLLYYSRYIRHDIFINVWTVLMFMAFFQFMRTRRNLWLYLGAAAVALMLSTKEVAFIHGFIGVTFIGFAFLWENLAASARRNLTYILLGLALITAIAGGYFLYGDIPVAETGTEEVVEPPFLVAHADIFVMIFGMLLSFVMIQLGVDRTNRPITATLKSLNDRLPDIGKATLLAVVIFVLLYTTFFSNIAGLATGTVGAVTYWLSQQEVQRGGQPWYYYLFLVPLYEFLPLFVALIGSAIYLIRRQGAPDHTTSEDELIEDPVSGQERAPSIWPSDGGTFAVFVIYWAVLATIIYSWAGEKMPWLTVHMTLPIIFVAAHVIQTALGRFSWSRAAEKGGYILGGAVFLVIPTLVALVSSSPFQSQSLQSINETIQFIAALVVLGVLGVVIWHYGRQMGRALATRSALVTILLVLTLLTVRYAWLLSYVNFDYVNEMLVYAHASPDVKLVLDQIDDISRRTVGDKMIKVAYDNDSTWPLEWYMREYPNRVYYGENPTREALDAPIVIVGSANESKVKPFLGDKYRRFRYRLVWWPVEDYKGQTFSKLWENYVTGPLPEDPTLDTAETQNARRQTVRDNWRKLWNIIFYRDYEDYELNEWPFVHRFFLYVRKDVDTDIWNYQSGPVELTQSTSLDPYDGKRTEFDAIKVWGSNGSSEGQFVTPRNLAVGPDGSIYVTDSGNHRIQVFDDEGTFLLSWGGEGPDDGQFSEPWGIAVSEEGVVYVADTWNHRIQAFSSTGQHLWSSGTFFNAQSDTTQQPGSFWGPRDIALDAEGYLYVTDTGNKRVQKFTPKGEFVEMWGSGGIIPGAFEEPVGIDFDSQGNIYVADTWNRRIQKFDPDFSPLTEWEVVGWESDGVVNKPFLTIDDQDRIYISDPEGYRIIVYDSDGEILVTWGQYGQDLASFALPLGLDFDQEGHLLVADSDNNRINKFLVPEIALGVVPLEEE